MPLAFLRDKQGNMAILGAAAMVPLTFGIGLTVDYSNIARSKDMLQSAVDAAALAIGREGPELSHEKAMAMARQFLDANAGFVATEPVVTRKVGGVTVQAKASVKLAFAGVMGYDSWPVTTQATASSAYLNYEIGLVLDTTGSMAGGKLASLKDAAIGFIDTTVATTPADQLKMAMVPFASFVNVGPQYAPSFDKKGRVDKKTGAWWLDRFGDVKLQQTELIEGVSRFEIYKNLKQTWAGCVETRAPYKGVAYDTADVEPSAKDKQSLFVPSFAIDEGDSAEYSNSYISSSVDPLDTSLLGWVRKQKKYGVPISLLGILDDLMPFNSVDVGGITAKKGPSVGCNTQPLTPLTADTEVLKDKIADLNAAGNTNIMEGVMWGWRVLSPREPFTEGRKPGPDVQKIMIVMTDGSNTLGVKSNPLGSIYGSFGYVVDKRLGPSVTSEPSAADLMNAKTLAACTNAKADGIEIFTIRLEEPDVKTGTMLKECATDKDHFLDVPSRSQLDEAFQQIRKKMTKLRLSS